MTNKQYRFLKSLSLSGVSVSKVERKFRNCSSDPLLTDPDFQKYFYRRNEQYFISATGKDIVEARFSGNIRWIISIVISVLALVISIVSIVLQYI